MITNCHRCGNYTIVSGHEVEGLLDVVRKLRSDVDRVPPGQSAVQQHTKSLRRLHFELEMLLARMNIDVWDMPDVAVEFIKASVEVS